MNKVERAILQTLVWFDEQQQPLTAFECWYLLWQDDDTLDTVTQQDVYKSLRSLADKGVVKTENGFWQLADSPSYTEERLARARWSINKRRRAQKAAKLLKFIPFIRLVALANTLATNSARRESDIDLLIITKTGRLYLTRFLVTALMQILGWRRHDSKVTDRICLSFYLSSTHLNIEDLSYQFDPYLVYWLASLDPLLDKDIYLEFLQANKWSWRYLPNRYVNLYKHVLPQLHKSIWLERLLGGLVGNMLEYWARNLQLFFIKKHKNSRLNDGSSAVVVNDSVLKFHESDKRPELAENFKRKQLEILNKYQI